MTWRELSLTLQNGIRVIRLRRAGCTVGKNVRLGHRISAGCGVTIGDGAVLQDGVILNGTVRIGKGCRLERMVEISGNVEIGDNSVVGGFSYLSTMPAGRIAIGRDVLVNAHSVIGAMEYVGIGDHCIFAAYLHITDATHGMDEPEELIKHANPTSAPVIIGQNVWLGSGVMVMMGTKIGDGAVVGAKSLVNKDIPPMSVAYGIPARAIRDRSQPKQVRT
jgi:galactoside O-acetyltransferase